MTARDSVGRALAARLLRALRTLAPSPRTARGKLGITAFLTTFLVLAGSTAGYAFWQSSLTVTSTLGAADLTISTTNFTSNAYTFGNETLVTTGSVTVTNSTATTSTQSGAVALTFGPNAAATLAGKVTLNLWSTTSAANCTAAATVPGTATSAFWSAGTVVNTTLAPSASAIYCLRSSIASRETVAVSGGTMTFAPKISGTITLGNFTGSAVATTTQSTQYIYPSFAPSTTTWNYIRPNVANASYNYCLDASGGGASTSGTLVISFGCKTSGAINQQWKFTASGVAGYYTIQPQNSITLRVDDSSSAASGAGLTLITTSVTPATAKNQQWQLQQISGNLYEFVSAYSGMCMTSPSGADQNLGQLTQTPCNGGVAQQFFISQALETLACSATTTAWNWTWASAATGPYHLRIQGSSTDLVATTGTTATGISLPVTGITKGTYNVNIVDDNNTVVATGSYTKGNTNNNNANSCTVVDPQ